MPILKYNFIDRVFKRKHLEQVIELRNDIQYLQDYMRVQIPAYRALNYHEIYLNLSKLLYKSKIDYPNEIEIYNKHGLKELETLLYEQRSRVILELEKLNINLSKIKTKIRKRKLNDILN